MTEPTAQPTDDSEPTELDRFIDFFLDAQRQGSQPTLNTCIARYPHLEQEIRELFPAIELMKHFGNSDDDHSLDANKLLDLSASFQLSSTERHKRGWSDFPLQIGNHRIVRLLGQGGMGQVFLAEDRRLNRLVALKVIKGNSVSESDSKRFQAEASTAAKLKHSNIVPIYEVGEEDGFQYLTMAYVEGQTLAERVAVGPLQPREAAMIICQVARAMAYAHSQGIIHRDLKPANIIEDLLGLPCVMDFGLAKRCDVDSSLTQSGQILATPTFMSPEQAGGLNSDVGVPSDVYSLGATLYCLLTGRPPFVAATVVETLRHILEREPVSPKNLNPAVPRDLETICLKCLQKRPEKRYATAMELGDELQRFLDNRSIHARPVSSGEKVLRWTQRNPLLSASLFTALGVFLVSFVLISWSLIQVQQALEAEAIQTKLAVASGNEAQSNAQAERWSRYLANMSATASALQLHNVVDAQTFLEDAPSEHRGWEWHHFQNQLDDASLVLNGHSRSVTMVIYSPDGKRLATGSADNTVRVWDSVTGEQQLVLRSKFGVKCISFSDDGERIACGSTRGITFWDSIGREISSRESTNQDSYIFPISKTSDHDLNFSTLRCIQFVDTNTGNDMVLSECHATIIDYTLSPDKLTIAVVGGIEVDDIARAAAPFRLLATDTGLEQAVLHDHKVFINSVCFGPYSKYKVSGRGFPDNFLVLWDAETGRSLAKLKGHENSINSIAYRPDGSRIASGSFDQTVRLWDGTTGTSIATLRDHRNWVNHVAFDPLGRYLVSASEDHTLRIWDAENGDFLAVMRGHSGSVNRLAFKPGGTGLASASSDGTVRIWNIDQMAQHSFLRGHTSFLYAVGFCPDGKQVHQIDAMHFCSDTGVSYSPKGDRIALCSQDGRIRFWDPKTGDLLDEFDEGKKTWIRDVAFDSKGNRIAAGSTDETAAEYAVRIWDIGRKQTLRVLPGHSKDVYSLAFSPDGRWLASGSLEETVRIWDAQTLEFVSVLRHGGAVYDVSFSPVSARLATGCAHNTIRLWDLSTFRQVTELRGHETYVHSLSWSPDGTQLVSGSGDFTVRIWDSLSVQVRSAENNGSQASRPAN